MNKLSLLLLPVVLLSISVFEASAFEFSGDSRFNGIEAKRDDPESYASPNGDGWICELLIGYKWIRDMSQPNIVKSLDGDFFNEDWKGISNGNDIERKTISLRFNKARGERVNNEYVVNVILSSLTPFQAGQTFHFAPEAPATSNIVLTITASDLVTDNDSFNKHCVL